MTLSFEEAYARLEDIVARLDQGNHGIAVALAELPLDIKGFGHVKLANRALARARAAELLHRFDPQAYPRPAASREAGQIRGIRVTAAA